MMNKKLEEYRDEEAYKEYAQPFGMPRDPVDGEYAFKTGFNAAIKLGLAVKFAEYWSVPKTLEEYEDICDKIGKDEVSFIDAYEYWLTNIYEIE